MKFIVPSHNRPDRVLTLKVMPNAALCVAESQVDEYRKHNRGAEFIVHPDDVIGISRKRQWILDNVGDCFMMDDDITHVLDHGSETEMRGRVYGAVLERKVRLLHETAEQLGVYLWGYAAMPQPAPLFEPYRLTGFMAGHCMGVRPGGGLYYNANVVGCDDGWISLLNAYMHRISLIDTRLRWQHAETFKRPGGLSEFRTKQSFRNDMHILRNTFGDSVVRPERNRIERQFVIIDIPF